MKILSPKILIVFTFLFIFFTVSNQVATANASDQEYLRIAGDNRLKTAIEISKAGWPEGLLDSEKAVIIARSDIPADALASASLAGVKDAPILLTNSNTISLDLLTELSRLGAETAYVLGGSTAISSKITTQLAENGISVTRLQGTNRFETAVAINEAAGFTANETVLLVNGITIADALSASSISANKGIPIYLSNNNSIPVDLPPSVKEVIILGGTVAISQSVESNLKDKGIKVTRIAGNNRYETNLLAANSFQFNSDEAILVRGASVNTSFEDYPDAVAASGLSAKRNAPIILSEPKNSRQDVINYLATRNGSIYVLGGTDAISQFVVTELKDNSPIMTTAEVKSSTLNVRTAPSSTSNSIGSISKETQVDIYSFEGDWAKILYNNEWSYVHAFYLNISGKNHLLKGHTIIVDPGHGAHDPGAIGNGLKEKDIVLDISQHLQAKLVEAGANVIMTRSTDVYITLEQRSEIANSANAHSFISMHANAGGETAHGTETFWNSTHSSIESKELAEKIQQRLIYDLNTNDRGAKEANFSVLRNTTMPSVLVEVGFLTNEEEAKKLADPVFRATSAEAIYQGILDFHRNK